jgi:endoglucanase
MYEICNEPNGSGGSWKNIKSYAASVIKTIRSVNANAIVIVGTPTWSQDVDTAAADKITGYKNIAYAFHFYAGTHKDSMRTKLEKALKKGLPVLVTEFGISEASGNGTANTSEGNKWITLLDKYSVGRVCWNLSNKNETSALIKSSCSKKSGWSYNDLSASGKWLVSTYKGKLASTKTTPTPTPKAAAKVTPTPTPKPAASGSLNASCSNGVKASASIRKVNSWKNGSKYYTQYTVTVKNTGTKKISKWTVSSTFAQNVSLNSKWSASYTVSGTKLTMKPLSWNTCLEKGQSTEFGFILESAKVQTSKSISISVS